MLAAWSVGFEAVQLAARKIPKSKVLRSPEIAESAYEQPVEVVMGSGRENLLLCPTSSWAERDEIDTLAHLYVLATVAARSTVPLPAVALGEIAFLATWSDVEQGRFCEAFAEALDETLRTHDPRPAREFVKAMASADPTSASPTITGHVSGEAAHAAERRFGLRR